MGTRTVVGGTQDFVNKNTLVGAIIAVLSTIVTAECLAFFYTLYIRSKIPGVDVEGISRKFDDQSVESLKAFLRHQTDGNPFFFYDLELGWVSGPNVRYSGTNTRSEPWEYQTDARGARQDLISTNSPVVGAFGDSFTLGAEVNDDEVWSSFFEAFSGVDVENFGVGGYCTFQSLLRMEREARKGRFKVLVLGIYSENINRIFNTYQPFYLPGHPFGFKPYIHIKNGVSLPRSNVADLSSLESFSEGKSGNNARILEYLHGAVRAAAVEDLHVNLTVPLQFPLVISGYNAFLFGHTGDHLQKADYLWRSPHGKSGMRYLLSRFVSFAGSIGAFPVVMIFPDALQSRRLIENPAYTSGYQKFFAEIKKDDQFKALVVIDGLTRNIDQSRFHISGPVVESHASTFANKEMAYRLAVDLKNAGQVNFVDEGSYKEISAELTQSSRRGKMPLR